MPATLSRDEKARLVFEEIRERPYRVTEKVGDVDAPNCANKGMELSKILSMFGYAVRGRIIEMDWREMKLPANVLSLYPQEYPATHYYLEVLEDGAWHALDASFDQELIDKLGYKQGEWRNGQPSLTPVSVYNEEDTAKYLQEWWSAEKEAEYFEKAGPFLKAVNQWLANKRSGQE